MAGFIDFKGTDATVATTIKSLNIEENNPCFKVIQTIFFENNLTPEILLSTPKDDLLGMFKKIDNDEIKEKIWKLRNELRIQDFDKRKEKDFKNVIDNDWVDLACFFYKTFGKIGSQQREEWFNYLEKEQITKSNLIIEDEEILNDLIGPLNLKKGQKATLYRIMKETKKNGKGQTSINVTHNNSNIGNEITGAENVTISGPITFNATN